MAANTANDLRYIKEEADKIADCIEDGDTTLAQRLCTSLLQRFPEDPQALHMQAMIHQSRGELDKAIELLVKAIGLDKSFEMAYFNLAIILEQAGRMADSEHVYRQLLLLSPKNQMALTNAGGLMHKMGKLSEAESYYRRFLELSPYHSKINGNLGAVLIDQGRLDEALPLCEKAVMLALDNPDAHSNCGIIYASRGDFDKAEKAFKRALKINPNYVPAIQNLETLEKRRANPDVPFTRQNPLEEAFLRGNKHINSGEPDKAVAAYREALALRKDTVPVLLNLGMALTLTRQFVEAEKVLKDALNLEPKNASGWHNLGNVYKDVGYHDNAIACYRQALAFRPDFFEAWVNLGSMLEATGKHVEAMAAYHNALTLNPQQALEKTSHQIAALAAILKQEQQLCQWDKLNEHIAHFLKLVDEAAASNTPAGLHAAHFSTSTMHMIPSTARQQWVNAVQYCKLNYQPVERAYEPGREFPFRSRKEGKIRIGYVSADFCAHATAYLIAGLFESHDLSKFELYAYSNGPDDHSLERQRIMKAMDKFRDIREQSDAQAAHLISSDGIDILIDLKGHTQGNRLGIFAQRPAPIQAHYLGYPATTGSSFIDYFIADSVVAPESLQQYFTEKLIHLPGSYQINDNKREMANIPSRAECGLPEDAFVFCSFNQNYKITPEIFDIWMRLLKKVPGSVLWQYVTVSKTVMDRLNVEAQKRGVDPKRLVFATVKPLPEHLARFTHADLLLDTSPINGHTTTSDALWSGVPVVTCEGETFVSRVASSLLHAVGLSELVTKSLADYESLALKLAQDKAELARLKKYLKDVHATSPLFDTKATTHHIEAAYLEMVKRHEEKKMPEPFGIKA